MKAIELELMTRYRYLSGLQAYRGGLLFIDTLADMDNNDYTQNLHYLDPSTGEDRILLNDKRVSFFLTNKGILVKDGSSPEPVSTSFSTLDLEGKKTPAFSLPLAVSSLKDLGTCFLVEATTDVRCPDYFRLSDEEKKAYHASKKADEDYLVLDEYPFFYNGAGFINGTRNGLYLVDKNDLSITRVFDAGMDVEYVDVDGDNVYVMGNCYASMKRMYSSIYCFNVNDKKVRELYHNDDESYLRRIFFLNGKLYAMGALDTCISGHNFFEVKDGKLELALKSEWMYSNSIGTDCRYGKTSGMRKNDDAVYFITVDNERSIVVRFDGKKLFCVTDGEGSVDDMAFLNGDLYVIAMKDMKLQEVYKAPSFKQLTCLNEEVLKDRYVAKPERFTCFNVDEIVGWALKPINFDPNGKYPMILDIHGGPKTAYGEVFYHEMQLWASRGYFVIFCNPHCSDGRGDEFTSYIKHYGATDYDDIMAFVDKTLELYPQIDPDRLAVTGGSYGGYMTNWIVTHTDRFKAAASQRSISNRVADFYYSDYSYDTTYENGIPLDEKAIELFWERSPLKYVENAVTPTLFIQSTEDYRCPFPEAVQLFSALKWKGVDTKICGFKGENHELSRSGKPKHRLRRLQEITDWLTKYTAE